MSATAITVLHRPVLGERSEVSSGFPGYEGTVVLPAGGSGDWPSRCAEPPWSGPSMR